MTRKEQYRNSGGYFGIGVYHPKYADQHRHAVAIGLNLGASFIFSIGPRFPDRALDHVVRADPALGQQSDTAMTHRHIPYMRFESVFEARHAMPLVEWIAIEQTESSNTLYEYLHPKRAAYLLGAEDSGLPKSVIDACRATVEIPSARCLNVAAAGTVILYDRNAKSARQANA